MESSNNWVNLTKARVEVLLYNKAIGQLDEYDYENAISRWVDRLDAALIKRQSIDQNTYDRCMNLIAKLN